MSPIELLKARGNEQTESDRLWRQVLTDVMGQVTVPSPGGPTPVIPFEEWMRVFLSPSPIKLVVGGEGSGKSLHGGLLLSARQVYDIMFGPQLYWVVGRDFEDARKDFDYYCEVYSQIGYFTSESRPNHRDQQCHVVTDLGHRVYTISSYDFTKIARDEPFGIIGAEVSRWDEETLLTM